MIIIKSDREIDLMRESGKVTGFILKELENFIRPGISTADIDRFVEDAVYAISVSLLTEAAEIVQILSDL